MCCDQGMDFDTYERGLWAGRAAAYERGFARLTAHTAEALLDAAGVAAGTRVLDVGTGPGVAARLNPLVDPGEWWEAVYLSRVGTNGVVIGRQDTATVARIKDEFDRVVARYAVDAGQVALPAVAVLGSGAAKNSAPAGRNRLNPLSSDTPTGGSGCVVQQRRR